MIPFRKSPKDPDLNHFLQHLCRSSNDTEFTVQAHQMDIMDVVGLIESTIGILVDAHVFMQINIFSKHKSMGVPKNLPACLELDR